ncbi:MAG TPA: DJ-1/PfpI family protein [Gemmatimonadaceae bacterium]|nr:DJ-1/PfpI family protein [Gemmatimonadaceae bacterium]
MPDGKIFALVFNGFADWEPAHALAELRRSGGYEVATVGFDRSAVISMGGMRVEPSGTLEDVDVDDAKLFLLPGGDMWEGDYPRQTLERVLHACRDARVPIAAICGATLAVARAGLLADRKHTSNAPEYLSGMVPGYGGDARYVTDLATRDDGVITASGLGAVDFAREIFAELRVFSEDDLSAWYGLFKHGTFAQPSH